jgi:chromosome segregation ATPase
VQPLVDDLINKLTEYRSVAQELAAISAKLSAAKAELEQVNANLELSKAELIKVESAVSTIYLVNANKHEDAIQERTQELRSLLAKVATVQANLDTKLAEVSSASLRHDQIEASIQSLRKSL